MKRAILISCASKKRSKKSKAKDLYISPLFKYNVQYAKSLNPDKIFILSAKYGLLDLNEEIEPYNTTLNKMNKFERKEWSKKILSQLKKEINLEDSEIIFLEWKNYRENLIPFIKNYKIPLEGLGIGRQLKWLKEKTNE